MAVKQQASIDLTAAQQLIASVVDSALQQQLHVSVAVVNPLGLLVAFAAMDGASVIASNMSQGKAKAALMGLSTVELVTAINDNPAMQLTLSQPGLVLAGGGAPLITAADGLIGAIGVGGALPEQDQALADKAVKQIFG